MPRPHDYQFAGFSSPNGTIVPDEVFDVLAPLLKESELRVLLYIVRRTFGFKKDSDNISLSQMVNGITTRDGRVLDHGTGMSRSAVSNGVKGLVGIGVLKASKNSSKERGNETTTYALRIQSDPWSSKTTRGSSPKLPALVVEDYQQLTVKQQTEEKEYSKEVVQEFSSEEREFMKGFLADFSQQFNDQQPANSVTRTLRLWQESGLRQEEMIEALYEARRMTQRYTGVIRNGKPGNRNKMPYFFSVLEDRLRDESQRFSG